MIKWLLQRKEFIIITVVAGLLSALLISLLRAFLTRFLKRIWHRFQRLRYALQVFPKGTVECLNKKHLAHKATMDRVRHFYEGGCWDGTSSQPMAMLKGIS